MFGLHNSSFLFSYTYLSPFQDTMSGILLKFTKNIIIIIIITIIIIIIITFIKMIIIIYKNWSLTTCDFNHNCVTTTTQEKLHPLSQLAYYNAGTLATNISLMNVTISH